MNKQTKELAKQAGFEISSSNFANLGLVWCSDEYPIDEQLERFAELVRDDERDRLQKHYLVIADEVRLDEREACAKLCENTNSNGDYVEGWFKTIAAAIRARCN